jgi:hypothetical protein
MKTSNSLNSLVLKVTRKAANVAANSTAGAKGVPPRAPTKSAKSAQLRFDKAVTRLEMEIGKTRAACRGTASATNGGFTATVYFSLNSEEVFNAVDVLMPYLAAIKAEAAKRNYREAWEGVTDLESESRRIRQLVYREMDAERDDARRAVRSEVNRLAKTRTERVALVAAGRKAQVAQALEQARVASLEGQVDQKPQLSKKQRRAAKKAHQAVKHSMSSIYGNAVEGEVTTKLSLV